MQNVQVELPEQLKQNGLDVRVALAKDVPEDYVKQILDNSRQAHVMKFEGHEDVGGRFKDMEAYREWAEKDRLVYLLMNGEEVGGVIWFGERENENIDKEYSLTLGIRLYEGFVGKGLSKPFMSVAHEDMRRFYPAQSIWLDYDQDNTVAGKAYGSFGYQYLTQHDGRIIMGYKRGE